MAEQQFTQEDLTALNQENQMLDKAPLESPEPPVSEPVIPMADFGKQPTESEKTFKQLISEPEQRFGRLNEKLGLTDPMLLMQKDQDFNTAYGDYDNAMAQKDSELQKQLEEKKITNEQYTNEYNKFNSQMLNFLETKRAETEQYYDNIQKNQPEIETRINRVSAATEKMAKENEGEKLLKELEGYNSLLYGSNAENKIQFMDYSKEDQAEAVQAETVTYRQPKGLVGTQSGIEVVPDNSAPKMQVNGNTITENEYEKRAKLTRDKGVFTIEAYTKAVSDGTLPPEAILETGIYYPDKMTQNLDNGKVVTSYTSAYEGNNGTPVYVMLDYDPIANVYKQRFVEKAEAGKEDGGKPKKLPEIVIDPFMEQLKNKDPKALAKVQGATEQIMSSNEYSDAVKLMALTSTFPNPDDFKSASDKYFGKRVIEQIAPIGTVTPSQLFAGASELVNKLQMRVQGRTDANLTPGKLSIDLLKDKRLGVEVDRLLKDSKYQSLMRSPYGMSQLIGIAKTNISNKDNLDYINQYSPLLTDMNSTFNRSLSYLKEGINGINAEILMKKAEIQEIKNRSGFDAKMKTADNLLSKIEFNADPNYRNVYKALVIAQKKKNNAEVTSEESEFMSKVGDNILKEKQDLQQVVIDDYNAYKAARIDAINSFPDKEMAEYIAVNGPEIDRKSAEIQQFQKSIVDSSAFANYGQLMGRLSQAVDNLDAQSYENISGYFPYLAEDPQTQDISYLLPLGAPTSALLSGIKSMLGGAAKTFNFIEGRIGYDEMIGNMESSLRDNKQFLETYRQKTGNLFSDVAYQTFEMLPMLASFSATSIMGAGRPFLYSISLGDNIKKAAEAGLNTTAERMIYSALVVEGEYLLEKLIPETVYAKRVASPSLTADLFKRILTPSTRKTAIREYAKSALKTGKTYSVLGLGEYAEEALTEKLTLVVERLSNDFLNASFTPTEWTGRENLEMMMSMLASTAVMGGTRKMLEKIAPTTIDGVNVSRTAKSLRSVTYLDEKGKAAKLDKNQSLLLASLSTPTGLYEMTKFVNDVESGKISKYDLDTDMYKMLKEKFIPAAMGTSIFKDKSLSIEQRAAYIAAHGRRIEIEKAINTGEITGNTAKFQIEQIESDKERILKDEEFAKSQFNLTGEDVKNLLYDYFQVSDDVIKASEARKAKEAAAKEQAAAQGAATSETKEPIVTPFTPTETAPAATDAKADIERRRQEEIKNSDTKLTTKGKRALEDYIQNPDSYTRVGFQDGSGKVIGLGKGMSGIDGSYVRFNKEEWKEQRRLDAELKAGIITQKEFSEKQKDLENRVLLRGLKEQEVVSKESELNTFENINAKYDAELNNLEQQLKTQQDATQISERQQQEIPQPSNLLQRQGVEQGQPQVGQGEGGIGQATQQAADTGNRPISSQTQEALKDVESTTKALGTVNGEQVSNAIIPNSAIKNKVYHGSENKFTEDFRNMNQNIDGFYFSSDIDNAKTYGENVIEAYVDIKNPLVIDAGGLRFTDDIPVKVLTAYPNEAPYETTISLPIDDIVYMVKNGKRPNQFIEIKDREKYDGIIFKNIIDPALSSRRDIPQDTVVAFDNSQIKRADNKSISEAYHKAKADGSNPELVSAVEDLLGQQIPAPAMEVPAVEEVVKIEPITKPEVEYSSRNLPNPIGAFDVVDSIPYTKREDNKFAPDQQLKFNQGENFEPVRIVGDSELIELIQIGARIRNNLSAKTKKPIDRERQQILEEKYGITATKANRRARELAKENRGNIENIIIIGEKPIAPSETQLDELVNLDVKEPGNLEKIYNWLDNADKALGKQIKPGKLFDIGSAAGAGAIATAQAIVKALKAAVSATVSLKDAIAKVAKDFNISEKDVMSALNIIANIEGLGEGVATISVRDYIRDSVTNEIKQIELGKIKDKAKAIESAVSKVIDDIKEKFGVDFKITSSGIKRLNKNLLDTVFSKMGDTTAIDKIIADVTPVVEHEVKRTLLGKTEKLIERAKSLDSKAKYTGQAGLLIQPIIALDAKSLLTSKATLEDISMLNDYLKEITGRRINTTNLKNAADIVNSFSPSQKKREKDSKDSIINRIDGLMERIASGDLDITDYGDLVSIEKSINDFQEGIGELSDLSEDVVKEVNKKFNDLLKSLPKTIDQLMEDAKAEIDAEVSSQIERLKQAVETSQEFRNSFQNPLFYEELIYLKDGLSEELAKYKADNTKGFLSSLTPKEKMLLSSSIDESFRGNVNSNTYQFSTMLKAFSFFEGSYKFGVNMAQKRAMISSDGMTNFVKSRIDNFRRIFVDIDYNKSSAKLIASGMSVFKIHMLDVSMNTGVDEFGVGPLEKAIYAPIAKANDKAFNLFSENLTTLEESKPFLNSKANNSSIKRGIKRLNDTLGVGLFGRKTSWKFIKNKLGWDNTFYFDLSNRMVNIIKIQIDHISNLKEGDQRIDVVLARNILMIEPKDYAKRTTKTLYDKYKGQPTAITDMTDKNEMFDVLAYGILTDGGTKTLEDLTIEDLTNLLSQDQKKAMSKWAEHIENTRHLSEASMVRAGKKPALLKNYMPRQVIFDRTDIKEIDDYMKMTGKNVGVSSSQHKERAGESGRLNLDGLSVLYNNLKDMYLVHEVKSSLDGLRMGLDKTLDQLNKENNLFARTYAEAVKIDANDRIRQALDANEKIVNDSLKTAYRFVGASSSLAARLLLIYNFRQIVKDYGSNVMKLAPTLFFANKKFKNQVYKLANPFSKVTYKTPQGTYTWEDYIPIAKETGSPAYRAVTVRGDNFLYEFSKSKEQLQREQRLTSWQDMRPKKLAWMSKFEEAFFKITGEYLDHKAFADERGAYRALYYTSVQRASDAADALLDREQGLPSIMRQPLRVQMIPVIGRFFRNASGGKFTGTISKNSIGGLIFGFMAGFQSGINQLFWRHVRKTLSFDKTITLKERAGNATEVLAKVIIPQIFYNLAGAIQGMLHATIESAVTAVGGGPEERKEQYKKFNSLEGWELQVAKTSAVFNLSKEKALNAVMNSLFSSAVDANTLNLIKPFAGLIAFKIWQEGAVEALLQKGLTKKEVDERKQNIREIENMMLEVFNVKILHALPTEEYREAIRLKYGNKDIDGLKDLIKVTGAFGALFGEADKLYDLGRLMSSTDEYEGLSDTDIAVAATLKAYSLFFANIVVGGKYGWLLSTFAGDARAISNMIISDETTKLKSEKRAEKKNEGGGVMPLGGGRGGAVNAGRRGGARFP